MQLLMLMLQKMTISGDKVVIETDNGSGIIKGADSNNNNLFYLGFSLDDDENWPNSSDMSLFSRSTTSPKTIYSKMQYYYGRLSFRSFGSPSYIGEGDSYISSRKIRILKTNNLNSNIFEVDTDGTIIGYSSTGAHNGKDFLRITMKGLPSSTTSIPANTVWVDSKGYLKIVK